MIGHRTLPVTAALFVLVGGILISFGIPRLWVSAVGGAFYGPMIGTLVSLMATMLGVAAVYHIGRLALESFVRRRLGARMLMWKERFRKNVFFWVLHIRLFPFSNSTLASLLCGSCEVPFWPYMAASLVGLIPLAFVFAFLGGSGMEGNYFEVALGFALMAVVFLAQRLLKRRNDDSSGSSQ